MTTYTDATDKTVDTWKQGAKAMTERMEFLVTTPSLDFVEPVERYFNYLQRAVDLNRELLTRWAELVSQTSGTLRDGALKAGHAIEEQVEDAADKAGELARQGKDMADKVVDEAGTAVDEAEQATDEATDTAEDLADDAADTVEKATSSTRSRRRSS
jgi:methyl-accepting chemotaxis protein